MFLTLEGSLGCKGEGSGGILGCSAPEQTPVGSHPKAESCAPLSGLFPTCSLCMTSLGFLLVAVCILATT